MFRICPAEAVRIQLSRSPPKASEPETVAALAPGYPAEADLGYPTPGSFGSKYGVDRGLEVVTVEVPYLTADEQAWLDTRAALRWCVDLPT